MLAAIFCSAHKGLRSVRTNLIWAIMLMTGMVIAFPTLAKAVTPTLEKDDWQIVGLPTISVDKSKLAYGNRVMEHEPEGGFWHDRSESEYYRKDYYFTVPGSYSTGDSVPVSDYLEVRFPNAAKDANGTYDILLTITPHDVRAGHDGKTNTSHTTSPAYIRTLELYERVEHAAEFGLELEAGPMNAMEAYDAGGDNSNLLAHKLETDMQMDVRIRFVSPGTTNVIPGKYLMHLQDLDIAQMIPDSDWQGTYDSIYAEGVEPLTGMDTTFHSGIETALRVNHDAIRGTHELNTDDKALGEVVVLCDSDFTFRWFGESCGTLLFTDFPSGWLTLDLASTDPNVPLNNGHYSLANATYIVRDSSGTQIGTFTTDANGKSTSFLTLNPGTYTVTPDTPSPGFYLDDHGAYTATVVASETTVVHSHEVPKKARISITKTSSNPTLTNGNRCYTLAGAHYQIYSDSNCTIPVDDAELVTGTDGVATSRELYFGNYWMKETAPPTGMNKSSTLYTIALSEAHMNSNYSAADDQEPVLYATPEIILVKEDKQLNSISQGDTFFKDAVYTVKYFDTYSTSDTPDATNKVVTADFKISAEDGKLHFASATPVPGSVSGSNVTNANTWPYRINNQNVFPLGTVTIKEKTPPVGYNIDETTHVFQVVEVRTTDPKTVRIDKVSGKWKNNTANDFKANEGEVWRGQVRVFKYDTDAFNDNHQELNARITQGDAVDTDGNSTFKGTTYKITNKSNHAIWVNGATYAVDAELPLIVANEDGEAIQTGLPYGTYQIEEVTPITGYLPTDSRSQGPWTRTFTIREDNQDVVYGSADEEDPFFRNLDLVKRGGLQIKKVDYDTRDNWTQGDAGYPTSETLYTFQKTIYKIYNRSKSYVYVDGQKYWPNTICATIESDERGMATLPSDALPYGTYEVYEDTPSEGYLNSGWRKTFTIRTDGQIVRYTVEDPTNRENQDTHESVDGDFYRNYEHVMRGDVIVNKLDWDTEKSLTTQGDAGDPATNYTFAGTTYAIKNVSRHPVYIYDNRRPDQGTHEDHLYAPGEVCLYITTDASGVAKTTGKTLPYGTYDIYEDVPTPGYMNLDPNLADDPEAWPHVNDSQELYDRVWHRRFVIDEDGDVIAYDQATDVDGRLRNEEPVIRGGIEIHKVDADSGANTTQGMAGSLVDDAYTFAGTTYEIVNESRHQVKVYWDDGSQRWVSPQAPCGRIRAGADGVARLDANALPYGTYTVREVNPPDGYRNSGWYKKFTIRENNALVKFDGTDNGNHQNQNTSDVTDADFKQNYEPVQRGGVSVSKVDAQTRKAQPQGDASLAGTVYAITNLSRHDVMVADEGGTMRSYAPYSVCLRITSDTNGIATSPIDALPYGHYAIHEATPPSGYHNSQWQQEFDIDRNRDRVAFTYVDNCNYDIVRRNPEPIEIRKYDAEYGDRRPTGAATLDKTLFKVTNQSVNAVLVDGVLHEPKTTVMTVETGSDGVAYIAAGALPVGRYEVTEVSAPRGYTTNSSWSQLITVGPDGSVSISNGGTAVECGNDVIRGDIRFSKIDAQTGSGLAGVAFAITSKTTGERHIVVTGANGTLNTSSSTADGGTSHLTRTNLNDSEVEWSDDLHMWVVKANASASNGVWFHGRLGEQCAISDSRGALPYDTYIIEELRCAANRDYTLSASFEVTVSRLGYADDGTALRVANEGVPPVDPMGEHGSQVTIYKDSTPAPNSKVKSGDEIMYRLSLRNTGKDVIERSLVRDYIPVGTDYVEGSASDGGVYVPASDPANGYGRGYIEWAIDDFVPRSTRYTENPLSFKVTVRYDAPACIENTAYVCKVTKTIEPGTPGNPEPDLESNTVYHKTGTKDTPAFVRIIKDSDPEPGLEVAWRSVIDYTLTVKNTGGSVALKTAVYDKIPEGTTYVSMDLVHGATLAPNGAGIGWIIDRLDPGESTTLKFRVKVTDRDLVRASGFVSNQASWGDLSNIPEPTPPTTDLDNTTDIIEHPLYEAPPEDAETYKWSDPEPETVVQNDDEITYELTTVNKTAETKPYTLVRDYIPEGTEYVEDSASDGGVFVAADAEGNIRGRAYVEWVLEDILPRREKKVSFKVKVTEDWRTYIRNHALSQTIDEALKPGDPRNPEPSQVTNEVKHRTPVAPEQDDMFPFVRVVKDSDPVPATMVDMGRKIQYTLTVTNDGKAPAYDVRVYDAVPEGTNWVSTESFNVSDGDDDARRSTLPRGDGRGVGWVMRKLDAGAEVKLVFTVEVVSKDILLKNDQGDMIVRNQAAWAYENEKGEEMPSPPASYEEMTDWTNRIDHPVPIDPLPQYGRQVTGYKDSDPAPNTVVTGGSIIEYEIHCVHTGVLPQEATLVRDYIPVGTEYVTGSATDGGVYVPADESLSGEAYVEWVLPKMVTGDEKSVFFKVRVVDGWRTYIRNHALTGPGTKSMTPGDPSNQDPPDLTNEVWHTTTEEEPTPEVVQVVKDSLPVPGSEVERDSVIRYILRVKNTGGSVAYDYGVHDVLQEGLEFVPDKFLRSCEGTVLPGKRAIAWVVPRLEPGESIDLWYEVKVADTSVLGDLVQNQATWGKRADSRDVPKEPQQNTSNIVEHPIYRYPRPVIKKEAITRNLVTFGDAVDFRVTVRNDGDADMDGWVLEDVPGHGLVYDSDNRGGEKQPDGSVRWIVNLPVGESFTVRVRMTVTTKEAGRLPNVATISKPDGSGKLEAMAEAEAVVLAKGEMAADLIKTGTSVLTLIATGGGIGLVAYRRMWARKNLG